MTICCFCCFIGCTKGWHGRVDIIIKEKEVPVSVIEPADNSELAESTDAASDKSDDSLPKSCFRQMLAQTVTFSFLSYYCNDGSLNSSLVPCIGISSKKFVVHMYDCAKDVLLASCRVDLFCNKELHVGAVVFL